MKIWLNRKTLSNRLVTGLIILGAICGLMTYAALTNVPPFGNSSSGVIILLNVNLIILLTLLVLVSRRIIALYVRRKQGIAGSNLHIRLVFIFSLLAALPAMVMAIFSVGFFYFGLHGWLDDRVRTAIYESQAVAEAYLAEHQQLIKADVFALATDLNRQVEILGDNPEAMRRMLGTQSLLRNFSDIYLLDENGRILTRASSSQTPQSVTIPPDVTENEIKLYEGGTDGIRAIYALENYNNRLVYVERDIDPKVLSHVEKAREGSNQYREIQDASTRLQIILTLIYVLITLLLTVAAIWFGLSFAKRLITPITDLINASEKARAGDLSVRVNPIYAVDEFKMLGHAFNGMTEQIESQQKDLMSANVQMDFRRRFTETILGGVSTGVLSVNRHKKITLANNAAGELLHLSLEDLLSVKISYIMPELAPFLDEAFKANMQGVVKTCEIQMRRQDQAVRTFIVRIVIENLDNQEKGAIITFDDLTSVLANQRKAAWADIARRIAHEIKNPLTPIQLSAERLNRKYTKNLNAREREVFDQCTETIIRHVGDIKTMVNSFAEFAKMPEANIHLADIIPTIMDVYILSQNAHSAAVFDYYSNIQKGEGFNIPHDTQQIRQVLVNLVKNALEACEQNKKGEQAHIALISYLTDTHLIIGVADNGSGLPKDIDIQSLCEPYVTNKNKGTGIGLAIVKKIIEDHDGELLFNPDLNIMDLMDKPYKTLIAFTLPLREA
jgi:two-component system nitrogen regulation sensor histidine kinase NtrY